MRFWLQLGFVLLPGWAAAAEEISPPAFTQKPVVTRNGEKLQIAFAVNRETDVAIYVENSTGGIVRHLVAGALGKNPPDLLKPGLSQSVEWDGLNDDGRKAEGFRVRVGLGLRPAWGGQAFVKKEESGPNQIGLGGVAGMTSGPDGRLYMLSRRGGKVHWRGMWVIHVFRRDGSYEQTIKPPPSCLPEEKVRSIGAFRNERGELTPLLHHTLNMSFYPSIESPQQMALTPQGQLLLTVQAFSRQTEDTLLPGIRLAALDREGGTPFPEYAGPILSEKHKHAGFTQLVSSSDGKAVFLIGLGTQAKDGFHRAQALFRVALPERGPAQAFFGNPDEAGSDTAHLNQPAGLASDGKGQLLVSDHDNNRVVVIQEQDGTFLGSFPVEKPQWLGIDVRSGAIYVQSKERVIKFSGWKEPKEVARLEKFEALLTASSAKVAAHDKYPYRSFALDVSANPPVLWIARNVSPQALMRCEDLGDHFSAPKQAGYYESSEFWNLSAEPAARKQVACRVEPARPGGNWTRDLRILDEDSGAIRQVSPRPAYTHQGAIYRLAPGGQIFCMSVLTSISRHDAKGAWLPFQTVADKEEKTSAQQMKCTTDGLMENTPTGSSGWTRDFFVARDGDVYVQRRCGNGGSLVSVDRMSGKTGKLVKTVIASASRSAIGPRVDASGKIYLAETLKPGGQRYPGIFERVLSPQQKDLYTTQYGAILQFTPVGGSVDWPISLAGAVPQPELPESLIKEIVPGNWYTKLFAGNPALDNATVRGARWVRPNFSKIGRPYCFCLTVDFDVDDFGRTFYPDLLQFRVGVLDANGNELTTFGGYGNQDCCGPESYVVDPQEKFLRPRRPDDPPGLASPSAKPELAFNWISGLAVTDRHAYVSDEVNRRVLRVNLEYAVSETVQAP